MTLMPTEPVEAIADGERVRYYRSGSGAPIVLLHGLGGAAVVWHRTMPLLAERYDVVVPELWSDPHHDEDLTPETGVRFVTCLLDTLGLESAHLVGSSLGGLLAGATAARHPERVRSLTLAASAGLGREIAWSQRLMTLPGVGEMFFKPTMRRVNSMVKILVREDGVSQELMHSLYTESCKPGVLPLMLRTLRAGVTIRGVKRSVQLLPDLAAYDRPVFVVWGGRDPLFPLSHAHRVLKALPDARLRLFERAGHWPYIEEPEAFSEALLEFVDEVEQRSQPRLAG